MPEVDAVIRDVVDSAVWVKDVANIVHGYLTPALIQTPWHTTREKEEEKNVKTPEQLKAATPEDLGIRWASIFPLQPGDVITLEPDEDFLYPGKISGSLSYAVFRNPADGILYLRGTSYETTRGFMMPWQCVDTMDDLDVQALTERSLYGCDVSRDGKLLQLSFPWQPPFQFDNSSTYTMAPVILWDKYLHDEEKQSQQKVTPWAGDPNIGMRVLLHGKPLDITQACVISTLVEKRDCPPHWMETKADRTRPVPPCGAYIPSPTGMQHYDFLFGHYTDILDVDGQAMRPETRLHIRVNHSVVIEPPNGLLADFIGGVRIQRVYPAIDKERDEDIMIGTACDYQFGGFNICERFLVFPRSAIREIAWCNDENKDLKRFVLSVQENEQVASAFYPTGGLITRNEQDVRSGAVPTTPA
jgi:hypothetical protein